MCKLIMIDDNPMEHMVMQKLFNRYEIFQGATHAIDGWIIIDFLRDHRNEPEQLPEIIFLDLNMPEYNGWLFLDELRLLYPALKKDVDVYILSSTKDKFDRMRATCYPFVKGFFNKPVKKEQM